MNMELFWAIFWPVVAAIVALRMVGFVIGFIVGFIGAVFCGVEWPAFRARVRHNFGWFTKDERAAMEDEFAILTRRAMGYDE